MKQEIKVKKGVKALNKFNFNNSTMMNKKMDWKKTNM